MCWDVFGPELRCVPHKNRILSSSTKCCDRFVPSFIFYRQLVYEEHDYKTVDGDHFLLFVRADDKKFETFLKSVNHAPYEYTILFEISVDSAYNQPLVVYVNKYDDELKQFEDKCKELDLYYKYVCDVGKGNCRYCVDFEYKSLFYVESDDEPKMDIFLYFLDCHDTIDFEYMYKPDHG